MVEDSVVRVYASNVGLAVKKSLVNVTKANTAKQENGSQVKRN